MATKQLSLFEGQRLTLDDAIQLSLASLQSYGPNYRHWAVAYSGGKDSSATVAFVAWAIKTGQVAPPDSLTVLYADTRQELPPLQQTAMKLLDTLRRDGFNSQVVLPSLDDRFYVYMFGRGVPPPKNKRFRWCTPQLKVEPMTLALRSLREQTGQKLLMLTGVRMGESAARDGRIAVSCSKDSGECGQGWFQVSTPESIADTLAPLLHWRLCHIYDWIYFDDRHGYDLAEIATVYGESDVRTGCIGCNLVDEDTALKRLIRDPKWTHLKPLLEIKPIFRELLRAKWRKRKSEPERRKTGKFGIEDNLKRGKAKLDTTADWDEMSDQIRKIRAKKRTRDTSQRLGPLTMEARAYGLERVLDIQARATVDLINVEEETRIRQLWALNTWPNKWDGTEVTGDQAIDVMRLGSDDDGFFVAIQSLLVK